MKILRTHRRTIGKTTIYVQECPTIWIVSTRTQGYSGGNTTGARCKKSECRTLESLANKVASEVDGIYEYTNRMGVIKRVCTNYKNYLFLKLNYGIDGLTKEEYELYKNLK